MLVYGSSQREAATAPAVAELQQQVLAACANPKPGVVRNLLVAVGEIAQGVADAQAGTAFEPPATAALRMATEHVGAALDHLEAPALLGAGLAGAGARAAQHALAAAVRCLTREQT
ncbi:MAG TPA: hypothetical protein VM536_04770, partial [Chloroflexia bacterium]|nr:hypothetical protein [Chloroflexia bacterium]